MHWPRSCTRGLVADASPPGTREPLHCPWLWVALAGLACWAHKWSSCADQCAACLWAGGDLVLLFAGCMSGRFWVCEATTQGHAGLRVTSDLEPPRETHSTDSASARRPWSICPGETHRFADASEAPSVPRNLEHISCRATVSHMCQSERPPEGSLAASRASGEPHLSSVGL